MIGRSTRWLGAMVIIALGAAALAAFMTQPTAEDILTYTAETLEAATSGHAVLDVSASTPEKNGTATVEVWGLRPAESNGKPALRMEVLETDLSEAEGIIAVSDGETGWLWVPDRNTVYIGTSEEFKDHLEEHMDDHTDADHPETAQEAVARMLEYFTADRSGREEMAGAQAFVVDLFPIPEKMPERYSAAGGSLRVWIDPDGWIPLGGEYRGGRLGGGRVTARSVELGIELPADLFTFQIPDGAEVVNIAELRPTSLSLEEAQAQAGSGLLTPGDLPEGAALVDVVEVRGVIAQRYSLPDGGSFTVAQGEGRAEDFQPPSEDGQSVSVRGLTGTAYSGDSGDRTLLTWEEAGVNFWVGGDLTVEQALAVAESLQ